MIKAILFDMDGVLFDSMPNHAQSWYEVITAYGIPCNPEEFYMHEGRTGFSTINILFNRHFKRDATEKELQEIYAEKCRKFAEKPAPVPVKGIEKVLKKVRENNLLAAIVTGSGQKTLFDKINVYFPGCFTAGLMVTAYDVKQGKPNPEPYLMGLVKTGVNANEAIVIENAPMGVEAGKAAGIFTVAVNTGLLPDSILTDAGADVLYPSMDALAEDFENLLKVPLNRT